jgi:hypothetical protein
MINFQLRIRTWRQLPIVLLGVVALGVGSSSCAKAQAAGSPDGPPLEMPEPPPRVLAPLDETVPATAAAPETPTTAPRPPARPPVRRPNGTPAEAEAAKPEPQQPAPVVATPPQPEPVPAETRELRAAPSTTVAAAERKVRDLLTRATRDLSRVDYGRLSADGRSQYEQSKRFSQQAEAALKDRNIVFAETLADKAATLATGLLASR